MKIKSFLFIILLFSSLFSAENTFLKEYTIDDGGRITSWHKKNGVILYYSYDLEDRLIELKSSDYSIHYTYKYANSIDPIEAEDVINKEKIVRSYYKNHLISEKTSNYLLQKNFDENDQLCEIIYPDGSFAKYIYGKENLLQVQRISKNKELLYFHEYRYNPTFLEETLINGAIQRTYYINDEARERQTPFLNFKIENNNKEEKITSNLFENSYEFNEKNELIKEKGPFTFAYSYDENYNRISQNETAFEYNGENQLISQKDVFYTYDQNGNLIEEGFKEHLSYLYDALDRLKTIISKNNYKLEFAYDALNRRVSKTLYIYNDKGWQKSYTRYFIYDDFNEIGALDENKEIIELKIHGKSGPFSRPIAFELKKIAYTPIFDLRNNLSALILQDNIVEFYCYSAFGMEKIFDANLNEIATSIASNPWGFALKRKEEASLLFFGKRFYKPSLGRWLTPDPAGCIDGSNLYAYALNNPIHRIDLYGCSSIGIDTQKLFFYFCRQGGKVASTFASALEYLNNEIIAFPFLNKVFSVGINCIKFAYSPWEIEPYIYSLEPLGKNNPKIRFGYLNGICNICPQECIDSGTTIIEKYAGDAQLDLYYSASHGCVIDYLECVFLKFNMETPNTERFKNLLRENLKKVADGGKYILFVHSKSAIIAKIAISQLTAAERAKIEIYASAPFELLNKDLCSSVKNILSKADGISVFNAFEILQAQLSDKFPLEWLDPVDAVFPSDHYYHALSYQLRLKKQMDDIFRRFGLNPENAKNNK